MRARVGWAILLIVAEKMTLKALSQRASGSGLKGVRVRKYSSGGGEYTSAVREVNMLGSVSRDWEGSIVRVS